MWGVIYAVSAFLIWGISPVYWKALRSVPALEIILHRIVWSFIFLVPLVILMKRWQEFVSVLKNFRTLLILLVTALFVGGNWLLYIWAVNNDHLLQASLGYYINPLVNVVLGMVFLKERLRMPQIVAVALATAGVLYLTVYYGAFPWIALTLAVSFGLYGLIRKVAPVGSVVGLTVETLLLSIPALAYLVYLDHLGQGSIFSRQFETGFDADRLCGGHGHALAVFYTGCTASVSVNPGIVAVYCPQLYVYSGGIFISRAVRQRTGDYVHLNLGGSGYLLGGFRALLSK